MIHRQSLPTGHYPRYGELPAGVRIYRFENATHPTPICSLLLLSRVQVRAHWVHLLPGLSNSMGSSCDEEVRSHDCADNSMWGRQGLSLLQCAGSYYGVVRNRGAPTPTVWTRSVVLPILLTLSGCSPSLIFISCVLQEARVSGCNEFPESRTSVADRFSVLPVVVVVLCTWSYLTSLFPKRSNSRP